VRRVGSIAKDGKGIIRMVFADGNLTVSATGEDQEISATMDTLNTQGEPGRTALDHKYLLAFLSGKQGIVILSKYEDTSPLVFQYQNSPRVLIMPMFVEWGDEKPTAAEKVEPEPETIEENPEVEPEEETEQPMPESMGDDGSIAVAQEPEPVAAAPTKTPAKRKRKR